MSEIDDFDLKNDEKFESPESVLAEKVGLSQKNALNIWLISYSDFMTILTIFFLALYGYTYLDAASLLFPKGGNVTYSAFAEMVEKLKTETGAELKVEEDIDKVTIELNEKILFASGRADVSIEAGETLGQLASSLNQVEGDIIVQGHTDNVPIRGARYESNWELSAARAFSIIEKLSMKGVEERRLSAWGFGEFRPVVGNITSEERSQNRRIEIVVLKKKKT